MKPLYALLRERCGLSIREAAEFHAVPENAVASWSVGRRNPPAGIITELRLRYAQIDDAAARLVEIADKAPAPRLRSSSASLPMTTRPGQSVGPASAPRLPHLGERLHKCATRW